MKKIVSALRTSLYFLSEILEFILSVISSLFPSSVDPNLSRGDIYIVTGYLSGTLFYSKLRKALEAKGYQPRILKVPSLFFNTKKAVEVLAKQMDQIPSKSVLLAHNTGGLLTLLLPDRSRQKIRGLVTLGTPFRGSHLFSILPVGGLRYGSPYLKELFKTFLFMDRFHPLAPLKEFIFHPASSSVYGEERDLWFDIPGNFNQVRKAENIRTILEFLVFHYPSDAAKESEKAAALAALNASKSQTKRITNAAETANGKKGIGKTTTNSVKVRSKKSISKTKPKPVAKQKPGVSTKNAVKKKSSSVSAKSKPVRSVVSAKKKKKR
ncbi:alpha/beta hydrolase [Leptospira barantonii]|uniref:Alpha/beta hydrolase n=1 Tax=Leptospira barantonii TaxID=2023184 RepID=A0A5F2BHX5_9LEPT|nr:alpha/beta hydrolase [Leptospira barantonii]TGM03740.1 alpha/beta hydrolase [Leptospira barantonii]